MIAVIAALTKQRVIGKDNALIWHLPEDMKLFRKFTSGNTVIMGRKTFESIGKPLPNRHNIVVSRSSPPIYGVDVCRDVQEALEKAHTYGKDIFIIGGALIYKQMLKFADTMYLSIVKKEVEGDAYFPQFNEGEWIITERRQFPEFEFRVYRKKKN